jgi:hypothetical protein
VLTPTRKTKTRALVGAALASTILFGAGSCDTKPSAADNAREARSKSVEQIRKEQPVHAMRYSPTLDTVNGWVDTWGRKGQVSYVYMQRQDGTFAGYYVLKGLPVNYCVGGSPPYDYSDIKGDGSPDEVQVPAPGLDGAYYGGCDSSRYYGFDAGTGQYIEYTDGMVLTAVLSNQPLPLSKQPQPFGSSIADVKAKR